MSKKIAITEWLEEASAGNKDALGRVFESLYDVMRKNAVHLKRTRPTAPIGATEVVHEAYLKLASCVVDRGKLFENRVHFVRYASRVMLGVLRENQYREKSLPTDYDIPSPERDEFRNVVLTFLSPILQTLRTKGGLGESAWRVFTLKHPMGSDELTFKEVAAHLGMPDSTVRMTYYKAVAYLRAKIESDALVILESVDVHTPRE